MSRNRILQEPMYLNVGKKDDDYFIFYNEYGKSSTIKKRIRKTERLIRTPNGNFLKSKKKKLINTIYFELKYFRLLKK